AGAAFFIAVASAAVITGASAPTGRYVISGGTVYDTKTLLTWQQTFSSSDMTLANAMTYCVSPWRLPTMKELVTLVDPSATSPTIDTTAFPGAVQPWFWTSTPAAGSPGIVWTVEFAGGHVDNSGGAASMFRVRCVH